MKKLFTTLFLLSTAILYSHAQFTPPLNFKMSYQYIMIGQADYCSGEYITGPDYCTHFSWEEPEGTRKPDKYKIYYKPYYQENTTISEIATTSETSLEYCGGIMGEVWVTAVYRNPNGESEPSNIEINKDLPISLEETQDLNRNLYYDSTTSNIVITDNTDIEYLVILNTQGQILDIIENPKDKISLTKYPDGIYLVRIEYSDSKTDVIKIIKK